MKSRALFLALCFILCTTAFASCNNSRKKQNRPDISIVGDTLCKNLNDSISGIMLNARTVKISTLSPDSATATLNLKHTQSFLLKYLLTSASDYKTNHIVYGMFSPEISIKMVVCKHKYVEVQLDFGLKKIRIIEKNRQQTFDLQSMELVRFCKMIFPENPHIDSFYKDYERVLFPKNDSIQSLDSLYTK